MPIDIEQFESRDEEALRAGGPTNAEVVLAFLAANDDQAFTPKEVHEATGLPRGSVGVVLSRLADRDLVRHRGEYWAIDPDAGVDRTLTALTTARSATERFGPEDPVDWEPGSATEDG